MGVKWATVVLFLFAMMMLPIPVILVGCGKRLRQRSSYETAAY